MLKSVMLRPRGKNRRDQVRDAIVHYPLDPSWLDQLPYRLERDRAAAKFSMAAYGGCTEKDVWDINLAERDPEKSRFLWGTPIKRHPRALEAMNSPLFALRFAGHEMRLNGQKVTAVALARALHVSLATLYRRHGKLAVRAVCQEPPLRVLASVGKKNRTLISAPSELD
jgi:hypothetical protein